MNELANQAQGRAVSPNDTTDTLSAGSMLRQAREMAGLHIGALAVALKVPVKKLEALEADRLDLLPDAVFARALAATVCRMLKVDPAPILAAFPQTLAQRAHADSVSRKPAFRPSGHNTQKSLMEKLSRPFILLGFAFAIGALVLMFYPSLEQLLSEIRRGADASSAPVALTPVRTEQGPLKGVSANEDAAGKTANPATADFTNAGSAAVSPNGSSTNQNAAVGTSAPGSVAGALYSAPPLPEGATSAAQSAADSSDTLMLTASGASWVEVTDAKRVVLLRKTLAAGESQSLGGVLPLTVTVGRANSLGVQIRGKSLDLSPFTKDNVARFEVK